MFRVGDLKQLFSEFLSKGKELFLGECFFQSKGIEAKGYNPAIVWRHKIQPILPNTNFTFFLPAISLFRCNGSLKEAQSLLRKSQNRSFEAEVILYPGSKGVRTNYKRVIP